jgi:oligopeptide transport system permease protein
MLEVIRSDYIRTARAKGLPERTVVLRHALKGAMLPTVSYLGPAIARIVTGSIIVERVFGLPGLGEFFITPALNRDYPMVLGVVVLYAMLLVLMNLIVDIAYTFLDPRVSYER